MKPFEEVIKLWDYMIVFGFHHIPVLLVAFMFTNRKSIIDLKGLDSSKYIFTVVRLSFNSFCLV
jgi:hypothetical protein